MTSRHYSSDAKEVNILIVVDCTKTGVKLGGCLTLRYSQIYGKTVKCSFNSFEQCIYFVFDIFLSTRFAENMNTNQPIESYLFLKKYL